MSTDTSGDQLRLLIERIERLESDKSDIAADIKDVYSEAKSRGFDVKIMRECIKLRKMEANARQEREALIQTYGLQLGLF